MNPPNNSLRTWTLVVAFLLVLAPFTSHAEVFFDEWIYPDFAFPTTGMKGSVQIGDLENVVQALCHYSYPNGDSGSVACHLDPSEAGLYTFEIPATTEALIGQLMFYVEVLHGSHGADTITSMSQGVPLGYEKELDITGDPPAVLLYPLAMNDAVVRYVPCCNILGAVIETKRLPVNPEENAEGLTSDIIGPFVVLEPDALAASTAGLYFEYIYSEDDLKRYGEDRIVPYTWVTGRWRRMLSYKIESATRTVSFHCPDGGSFVLGTRPLEVTGGD